MAATWPYSGVYVLDWLTVNCLHVNSFSLLGNSVRLVAVCTRWMNLSYLLLLVLLFDWSSGVDSLHDKAGESGLETRFDWLVEQIPEFSPYIAWDRRLFLKFNFGLLSLNGLIVLLTSTVAGYSYFNSICVSDFRVVLRVERRKLVYWSSSLTDFGTQGYFEEFLSGNTRCVLTLFLLYPKRGGSS